MVYTMLFCQINSILYNELMLVTVCGPESGAVRLGWWQQSGRRERWQSGHGKWQQRRLSNENTKHPVTYMWPSRSHGDVAYDLGLARYSIWLGICEMAYDLVLVRWHMICDGEMVYELCWRDGVWVVLVRWCMSCVGEMANGLVFGKMAYDLLFAIYGTWLGIGDITWYWQDGISLLIGET